MKKILIFILVVGQICLWTVGSMAFINYNDKLPKKLKHIKITGYTDCAPFGFVEFPDKSVMGRFFSAFEPLINDIAQENNLRIEYDVYLRDHVKQIQKVRQGDDDLALGVYHDTEMFKGLEILFPAAFINPITVFMMPNRINEVKTTDDLKKLKGVRSSRETYSDFVEEQLKEYDIDVVDNSYDLFGRLFTGKADYILVSQYYGLIEASKLGLRKQISVAKQTLWQVPMFIGVSKLSKHRKLLSQIITRWLEIAENRENIKQNIIRIVNEAEIRAQGTVPPTFENVQNQ